MARPAWWVAAAVGSTGPTTASEAFAAVAGTVPALAGLTYADLGLTGRVVTQAPGLASAGSA
jgi:hypothetical protein